MLDVLHLLVAIMEKDIGGTSKNNEYPFHVIWSIGCNWDFGV